MSKYHAIGKENWEALPNIFNDTEEAEGLADGTKYWAYTYMFPHATREGVNCTMEAGISYSKLNGMFTKYVKAVGED